MLKLITSTINSRNHLRSCTWCKYRVLCCRIKDEPLHRNLPTLLDSVSLIIIHWCKNTVVQEWMHFTEKCFSTACLWAGSSTCPGHSHSWVQALILISISLVLPWHVSQQSMGWFWLGGYQEGTKPCLRAGLTWKLDHVSSTNCLLEVSERDLQQNKLFHAFFPKKLILILKSKQ